MMRHRRHAYFRGLFDYLKLIPDSRTPSLVFHCKIIVMERLSYLNLSKRKTTTGEKKGDSREDRSVVRDREPRLRLTLLAVSAELPPWSPQHGVVGVQK